MRFVVFSFVFLLFLLLFLKSFPMDDHIVLLSFDVEPVDALTPLTIADILDDYDINATFFVTGTYANQYPDVVKRLSHFDIGCHSFSHPHLTFLSDQEQFAQVSECKKTVESIIGRPVEGFRAPYLFADSSTFRVLKESGYVYDASVVSGLGLFYPKLPQALGEVPVSSVFGVPMMDMVFTYYLKLPGVFFYFLENKNKGVNSFLFHPHHVVNYEGQLNHSLQVLKDRNAIFISHSGLIKNHEGG